MIIVNDKGNLGLSLIHPVVAAHPNQLIGDGCHQSDAIDVINVGESMEIAFS
jgi:hypothetical protein